MAVIAALAVVVIAVYVHWRDNPRELYPYQGVSGTLMAGQVGKTFYADAGVTPRHGKSGHEELNMSSLLPVVTTNTAHATVTMLICVTPPGQDAIGGAYSTRPYCSSARRFDAGMHDLGYTAGQVLYAITARRPGTVRIEGCLVSYQIGARSGTQHAGTGFVDHIHAPDR